MFEIISVAGQQESRKRLCASENLVVCMALQPKIPDIISLISVFTQNAGCRSGKIFVDKKARHQARARISCCSRTLAV